MSKCAGCHEAGGGCCNCHDSGIFITLHDALRVSKATGLKISDFAVFNKAPDEWLDELKKNEDSFYDAYVDGKILQLKLTDNGCVFLGPTGCKIFNDRPGLCRLFPFTYDIEKGKVTIEMLDDENCDLAKLSVNEALKDLDENEDDYKEFLKKYDKEYNLYFKYAKRISEGAPFEEVIKEFKITV